MELTVAELAQRIGARLAGHGSAKIAGVRPIEAAQKDHVTFVSSEKYVRKLEISRAGAIIVAEPIEALDKPQLIVDNVDAALIAALETFAPKPKPVTGGIDPTAKLGDGVRLGEGVAIGAGAVIGDGVEIGPSSVIGGGCKIGQDSKLGRSCRLDSNVVIYHNCRIGNNVVIQANSTVGSTGFGYCLVDGAHRLIPHNGGVVIEDFVEIGANCCIDRAKFNNTVIGAGTKIDNLVQIAHNVQIGKCCLIAGCVGIAGSCKIGDGVVLAGQVGVVDNVEIGDGTIVGAHSLVTHKIPQGRQLFGTPATDKSEAFKIIGLTRRLPRLQEQLRELNSRVEQFEKTKARSRIRARLKWACVAAVVIVAGLLFLRYSRVILDPHEYEVEHIVEEYQDGDDNFYVSANSHFEDLRINKNLSIINDIMEAPERIAADRANSKDSLFLICYKDLDRLKRTTAWKQLLFVKEIDVEGVYLVLLSTEVKPRSAKVRSRRI